ncbi:enolase C-terminal domain-like protein [Roseibium marinum]|uniref:L-alanine-DL-glutamate epimerase-like enolase superfamily enzyme n=1 Tax=Roseibium marinum TaxID=281252 RepID=A0A2S3UK33_9HYPH|nr:enolase C-terminal domain-like protein [Roseibium marinum]POF27940.1 L-alanine-DL-glutamate epimerase-like enolase superfamily enzyme [Roseibium marinum]
MPLVRAELWKLRLPLRNAVEWTAGGAEASVPYVILLLQDDEGRCGAAEITCRPAWNGFTQDLMINAFRQLAWPLLVGLEAGEPLMPRLSGIRGMTALKALCDNAWHDLGAPAPKGGPIRVASVLTRMAPDAAAEAALKVREETGINAFKVKLGQGISQDAAVLAALRRELGTETELSGDANSSYSLEDLPALFALAREMTLSFLEDPVPLLPDAVTGAACASFDVPVLVDKAMDGARWVRAFADRGLLHASAKPNRIGVSEAREVATAVAANGGRVCDGTYSESALGAAAQIAFAQSLPEGLAHPHEIDFHRGLSAQVAPLPAIRDGTVEPVSGRIAERLDRETLDSIAAQHLEFAADAKAT